MYGIQNDDPKNWPKLSAKQRSQPAIDRLLPNSDTHNRVLQYLKDRINLSERAMQNFYPRWNEAELKLQGYIWLPEIEKRMKEFNATGRPPQPVSIILPYAYATVATKVTYHYHTFGGRKPFWQVTSTDEKMIENASIMEIVLQYNADHTRFLAELWQFLMDTQSYGVGIFRPEWLIERKMRTKIVSAEQTFGSLYGMIGGEAYPRVRDLRTTYEGNRITTLDPYMFFPDPRVPMWKVNAEGEFVFWRNFMGRHRILKMEQDGTFSHVKHIPSMARADGIDERGNESRRSAVTLGEASPGDSRNARLGNNVKDYIQLDQGTVEIIPAELGLGESQNVEKWLFTIANKGQIIQAEPFEADHDLHPVAVAEPTTIGYGFGQPSTLDMMGPLQDLMSWFVNSHIHNVRSALHNMFIVDPSRVEMQDVLNPKPGKTIRVKPAAFGQNVDQFIRQLNVADVTQGHMRDLPTMMRITDMLTAVTDNVRGLQDAGGRKTATEVRTSAEAASSRLAAESRLISAQAITLLGQMMAMNIQQYISMEFSIAMLGDQALRTPIKISPDKLSGDFTFPIHDGTLPLDRVALLDIWKELWMAVSANPQLAAQYDGLKMFEYMAELSGARNLETFKIAPMQPGGFADPAAMQQQVQAGNALPMPSPGIGPGRRQMGALQ